MYIDYKCSIWQRIHLKADVSAENVLEYLRENPKADADDLFEKFGEENEILYDTEERLSIEDNSENDTIEFFDVLGNQIWNNKEGVIK